jgi:hypothetical protein
MTQGSAACPTASRVGRGELDVDTGIDGPERVVQSRVTEFNNENELILLVEQDMGSRVVSRTRIEGGKLTSEAPPLPGGPPDGFTAIKKVRIQIDRVTAHGKSYVTTPPTCPASGSWANTVEFRYRDGVSQSVVSRSPCTRRSAAKPKIRLAVAPATVGLREPTRFRMRATRVDGGTRRAVPGATVAIGRKHARTGADGRATITETFYRSNPHRARACKAGFRCGEAFVAVAG